MRAPALLVALYAGGKGARALSEVVRTGRGVRRLQVPALDVAGLKAVVDQLEARLGGDAIRELGRYIEASREAGLLVAQGGELAAAALYEARGHVPKARQAWLSEARSQRAGPTSTSGGAGMRESVPLEVLKARLLQAELEMAGPRLPRDVEFLRKHPPFQEDSVAGVEGRLLWGEYVTYRARRLAELEKGASVEGPLQWDGYLKMRGLFARGLAFETPVARGLQ